MIAQYTIPVPPSANKLFAGVGRRFKSPPYKRWIKITDTEIMAQRVGQPRFDGPVSIVIAVPFTRGKRDVDNHTKPIVDALVRMKIIPDDNDNHVKSITTQVGSDGDYCVVNIRRAA